MPSRHWRQPRGRGHPDRRCRSASPSSSISFESSVEPASNYSTDNDTASNYSTDNDTMADINNCIEFTNQDIDWDFFRNEIFKLPGEHPSRKAYSPLLKHEVWPEPKNLDPRWQPLGNLLHWFLFLGWFSAKYGFTREQIQWILNMLLTLQHYGYIDDQLWIPSDPTTIAKWKRYFVSPPLGMC